MSIWNEEIEKLTRELDTYVTRQMTVLLSLRMKPEETIQRLKFNEVEGKRIIERLSVKSEIPADNWQIFLSEVAANAHQNGSDAAQNIFQALHLAEEMIDYTSGLNGFSTSTLVSIVKAEYRFPPTPHTRSMT